MSMVVRTVSADKRPAKKARRASRVLRMPLGLQRYINKRGTMDGTYEFTRTVTGRLDFTNAGVSIGAARYSAATWVINPQSLQLVSGVPGNTNTYNIPNAAEFAALFDKIKIDKVEMTFMNAQGSTTGTANGINPILFCEDDNDTNTSTDAIKQMDCEVWQPGYNNNVYKKTWSPKYQRIVYYTALTSSYEPSRGYVVSDTAIPHYGLKMGVELNNDISFGLNFSAKIHFKLKEVK